MKLIRIALLLSFNLIMLDSCSLSNKGAAYGYNPTGVVIKKSNSAWDSITVKDKYRVVNNVWNRNAATGIYAQKIFTEKVDGIEAVGWQWNWKNQSRMVVAYPEIIFGDKPWDALSGILYPLPVRAGSSKITTEFESVVKADGVYNMAFSIWCVSSLPQKRDNITHEIMIWTLNNGMFPAGRKYSNTIINGIEYDVYVKTSHTDDSGESKHSWTYVAYVPKSKQLIGSLVISDFVNYLIDRQLLDRDYYITSIEFGNEIVNGSGCTEILNYSVSVDSISQN